jgi:hypothetical protein
MGKVHTRLCVFAAIALMLVGGWASSAQGLVLDWDAVAWADGSLNNSYDLNGDANNDITVDITSQQSNIWTTDPATGTQTPAVNQSLTGGLAPAENSLNLSANLKTNSNVTVHITFTGAQGTNVSFTLFDIDITTNSDIIDGIFAIALDGTFVAATITNVGSAVTLTGTGFGQTLTGNSAAADNSSNGNATISFGATTITDVFFNFSNTSGAPRFQNIGIGDVSFTPVPEINPATTAAGSCIAAMVLTVLLQRRARRARQSAP